MPLDSEEYERKAEFLSILHQYVEGTYTIFPEKKQAVEIAVPEQGQISMFDFMEQEPQSKEQSTAAAVEKPQKAKVVARYQSTVMMQEGYIENIAILQYSDGKFYNHYNYDEETGTGTAETGPFNSLNDAKSVIHDYFIAKSLDLVRPGGVVAVVTSSGTMDKKDSSVREYLSNRADLVGAIRLPNNAFQRNANTGVVADILFLQKRDRAAVERAEWVDLGETPEGYSINQYFAKHPEMVLGKITTESTQYGKQETTVKPIEGADLAKQLKEAVGNIQATITEPEISDDELDVQEESIPADPSVKNFSFTNVDGQIYYRENSFMNKVELPAVTAERVLGMIALRETTRKLLDCQLHDGSDAEVQLLQNELKQQSALRHKPQWFRLLLTSYQRK